MKKLSLLARLSLLLIFLLLVAAVAMGCGEENVAVTEEQTIVCETVGEGEYSFDFTAVFADGSKKSYAVFTDCETVGEALLSLGLIDGEDGPYGLYIKSVCGVIADYDKDQTYWALYTDGEMSMAGADMVKCADVSLVELKVEK